MKDLSIALENRPGALAAMGEALGRRGVSIEGGGAWVVDGKGVAISSSWTEPPPAQRWKVPASRCSPNGTSWSNA